MGIMSLKIKPKIKVKQGIIHINSIVVLQCTDEVIWLSADCKQKYPEITLYSGHGVMVGANNHTLHVDDKNLDLTEISISNLSDEWAVIAEAGRYTCSIVFVKFHDRFKSHNDPFEHLHWDDDK